MSETKPAKPKKKTWLYVFYGLLTVGILFFILSMNDLGEIFGVLKTANARYILVALLLLLIYLALYPLTLCFLAKAKGVNVKRSDVYFIGMTEHFFNGITPFATGGQPFQVYALSQKKVLAATSTGLLIMNFLIFMAATNTFAIVSLIYFKDLIKTTAMTVIAIIGFTMNFLVFVFIFMLGASDKLRKGIVKILTALSKIKILKKLLGNKTEAFNEYTKNTQAAFKELNKNKKTFLLCYVTRLVTMFVYYSLTFYIIKALNVNITYDKLFFTVCGTAFAVTTVVFLPTPGSSGGIEFAFSGIFSALALGADAATGYGGMLLWRLITYYLTMLISLAFYLVFEARVKRDHKRFENISAETETSGKAPAAANEKNARESKPI